MWWMPPPKPLNPKRFKAFSELPEDRRGLCQRRRHRQWRGDTWCCWWYKSCITLRTLNYGNYGRFLILGTAGFISSTVCLTWEPWGFRHGLGGPDDSALGLQAFRCSFKPREAENGAAILSNLGSHFCISRLPFCEDMHWSPAVNV